ncbi:MAG: YitT family protein, partial [Leptolinea sp.]
MSTPSESGREYLLKVLNALGHEKLSWGILRDYAYVIGGAVIQALAMRLFLVPAQLVSGGISGIGQIVNAFTGWPIGLMIFLG